MNSPIKRAAKVAEELNQSNENSDTKTEGNLNFKATLTESLKIGKQSNISPVYYK
jgi:hypothetical protein